MADCQINTMHFLVTSRLYLGVVLSLLIILFIPSCKGSKRSTAGGTTGVTGGQGGGDAGGPPGGGPGQGGPEENQNVSTVDPYTSNRTPEELQRIYESVPDSDLTTLDRINRDFAFGAINELEAGRQKICYYFGHACLNQGYKVEGALPSSCGTSLALEIDHAILLSTELRAFYESVRSESEQAGGAILPNQVLIQPGPGTPNSTHPHPRSLVSPKRVDLSQYLKRTVDYAGRSFDIFYKNTPATLNALPLVDQCLTNSNMWTLANKVFYPGIKPVPPPGYQNYPIFLVDGPLPWSAGSLGVMVPENPAAGSSRIAIQVISGPAQVHYERGTQRITAEDLQRGVCTHEMYHALSYAFFKNGINNNNPFIEAMPEWFAENSWDNGESGRDQFRSFLYNKTNVSFDDHNSGSLELRKYGVALFLDYLSCRATDPWKPIREYNQCYKGPFTSRQCSEGLLRTAGLDPAQELLQFGESLLNFKDPPEGVLDLRSCMNNYHDFFHPHASSSSLISLPDSPSPPNIMAMWPKIDFRVEIENFSVEYLVFSPLSGNTVNNYYKIDLSSVCTLGDMKCSAFMIRVNQGDRSKFDIVHHEKIPPSGILEYTAEETDSEPDILVLVLANGGMVNSVYLGGSIETRVFSAPAHFTLNATRQTSDVDGSSENVRITFEGDLDHPNIPIILDPASVYPELPQNDPRDYPLRGIYVWEFGEADPFRVVDLRQFINGLVPLKQGIITWNFEQKGPIENGCPVGNRYQRVTSGEGSHTLDLESGDNVTLILNANRTASGENEGHFIFNSGYYDPGFSANLSSGEECVRGGCCRRPQDLDPRRPLESSFDEVVNSNAFILFGEGTFTDGATTLTITNPDAPDFGWVMEGTITLPQPIEIPRDFHMRGYQWGWLMNSVCDACGPQYIPPVIDFR